jgi:hypothetical protein
VDAKKTKQKTKKKHSCSKHIKVKSAKSSANLSQPRAYQSEHVFQEQAQI